mgnify:CR=1 FL=1
MASLFCAIITVCVLAAPAWAVCSGGDDTAALNALVQAGGEVVLPAGTCHVTSLNATNLIGAVIRGQGPGRTILIPTPGAWAAIVDLTGSYYVRLADLTIGTWYLGTTPIAPAGLLTAQRAGDMSSNRLVLDNVTISGCFSGWAWYNFGVASSSVRDSAFWNFCGPAVTFTSSNIWGMWSQYQALTPGIAYAADWKIVSTEMHADRVEGGAGSVTFVCAGCSSLRLIGCTLAGSGPALVWGQTVDGVAPGTVYTYGTFGYSDNGTPYGAFASGVPVVSY